MSVQAVKTVFRQWKLIFLVGLLVSLLSGIISLLLPLEYRADAQVLIISQSRFGVDPYTVVKSAEGVSGNIAQIMLTDDFFNKVLSQEDYNIDMSQFENISEQKKRQKWQRIISPSVVFGTGLLNVSAYHTDPDEAAKFAGAAVDTLVEEGWEYVGSDVVIRVVNEPVVTSFPVRPNIIVNVVLGFVVGIVLMGFFVLRKEQKRSVLHRW